MAIKLIRPDDWHTQAWQNGGGISHQLARCDDNKGMRWRLSIAEVAADGPFSRFENIDRIILLLEGDGFCLHGVGDAPQILDKTLQPFAFAGETEIDCKLIKGPVRDFNLMSRRHDVSATLQVVSVATDGQYLPIAAQTFVHVLSGSVMAEFLGHIYPLATEYTLSIKDEVGELHLSSIAPSQLLLIKLNQLKNCQNVS
jgi:environmental stress-induced protein Ves